MKLFSSYIESVKAVTNFVKSRFWQGIHFSKLFNKARGGLSHPHLSIKLINKTLLFFSIFLTLFLLFDFLFCRPNLEEFSLLNPPSEAGVLASEASNLTGLKTQGLNSLSFYLSEVNKRDIFSSPRVTKEKQKVELQKKKKEIANLVKNFNLVGIFYGEGVTQAMIEDRNINKTYFVQEKDKLKQLEIKSISRDKVVLGYEGEEWELR
ncbi:MAG: hypothetical protein B5M48_03485 [Candidatus Omnitrophica bacterium 4484_213]|nr:MAG: hypothetical protein B5M48_03485 [Candidatus Omnitrophica bacterium 4484_213]